MSKKKQPPNVVADVARESGPRYADGTPYATSAELTEAFRRHPEDVVHRDALEILSGGGGVGYEDARGFAFVAWQGRAGLTARDE